VFHVTSGWSNWSGSVKCEPSVAEPATVEELSEHVKNSEQVRPAGSGHSFSPLVATDDTVLSLDEISGVTVDRENREATVRAGTELGDLTAELARNGLAMENLGDIDRQTVSGATATGTHGTGEFGVLSTQVSEIEVVAGDGSVRTLSRGDDAFGAAQVSLGALGVVTEVVLDVVPSYWLELVRGKEKLNTTLSNFQEYVEKHRNFEFFWFPGTGTAVTKKMNETEADPVRIRRQARKRCMACPV
jgi:FAD/FMN-containing dehydrogenase